MRTDIYQSPLCGRYASYEMQNIFSADQKFHVEKIMGSTRRERKRIRVADHRRTD